MEFFYSHLSIFLRSLFAFFILFLLTRCLGKKQISQLTFFDYITGITIGSIAASCAVDAQIDASMGLVGLLTWTLLSISLSYVTLKKLKIKRLLDGTPTIVIQQGKILYENLKQERFTVLDLLEELRLQGVFCVEQVNFAILENGGRLSILLKSQFQPMKPKDLNILTKTEGLPANLIIDGCILQENLALVDRDETWLCEVLKNKGFSSISDVTLATLKPDGPLIVTLKSAPGKIFNVLE